MASILSHSLQDEMLRISRADHDEFLEIRRAYPKRATDDESCFNTNPNEIFLFVIPK